MFVHIYILLLFNVFGYSLGIIYHLNETEHKKLPPLFELDDYDSCMENSGVYCTVAFALYGEPDNEIYTLIREYSKHTLKHFNYTRLERGICVRETCQEYIKNNSLDIDQNIELVLEGCFNETIQQKYNLGSKLQFISCENQKDKRQEIQLDNKDITMLLVIGGICAVVAWGSYYDLRQRRRKADKTLEKDRHPLLCFSIFRHFENLLQEDKGDERLTELKGLHGIRAFNSGLIVLAHCPFMFGKYIRDPLAFEKFFEYQFFAILGSYSSIVQFFFFISGFLMTYILQIQEEKYKMSFRNVPQIIFLRWWRMTPSFAVVIGIMATLFRHVGSGPIWKSFIVEGVTSQCREYYWAHIFYINNFMINDILCCLESWHIASDMQLSVLGIIVYFCIRRRSWRFKIGTLSFLLLLGILSPIVHVYFQDLNGLVVGKPELFRTFYDDTFRKYHVFFYNNITCFVMGMAIGYLVYYLKQNKIGFPEFKIGTLICWLIIPSIYAFYYFTTSVYDDIERKSLTWRLLYASLHRVVIGIIASVWVLGLTLKFHGNSLSIWEWRGWLISSKLSFCVYLIHDNIILYMLGTRSQLYTVSFSELFYVYLLVMFWAHVLALVLHLFVEAPCSELLKILMGSNRKRKEA